MSEGDGGMMSDGDHDSLPSDAPASAEPQTVVVDARESQSPQDPPTESAQQPRSTTVAPGGQDGAMGGHEIPTLFQQCLRAIARQLKSFCNTRLYPAGAPPLNKAFEQALSVYDLAPLTLLDEQRCFERIAAALAAQLRARRAKVKDSVSNRHRLEVVPAYALCPDPFHDSLAPLKTMLGLTPLPYFEFRARRKSPAEQAVRLRKLEKKWVSTIENRPPVNVDLETEDSSTILEEKPAGTETLKLSREAVTNTGCGFIAERLVTEPKLLELSLQNCQISCAGAVLLANALATASVALRQLDLSNSDSKAFRGRGFDNDIRDTGASALAMSLTVNRSVVFLSLSNNHVGRHGALALASMLHKNGTLRELELSKTSVGDAATELVEGYRRSKTLDTLNLQWCGLRPGLGTQLAAIQAARAMRETPIAMQLSP